MKDCSGNNININIDFSNLQIIIEYVKQIKKERDYYKKIVKKHLPLLVVNND